VKNICYTAIPGIAFHAGCSKVDVIPLKSKTIRFSSTAEDSGKTAKKAAVQKAIRACRTLGPDIFFDSIQYYRA